MADPTVPIPKGPEEAKIGAAFRAARTGKGVTLAATAASIGVSVNSVRWHEGGASIMPPEKVFAAAKLFKASPEALGITYHADREAARLSDARRASGFAGAKA